MRAMLVSTRKEVSKKHPDVFENIQRDLVGFNVPRLIAKVLSSNRNDKLTWYSRAVINLASMWKKATGACE